MPGGNINYLTGHAIFEATHARPRNMPTSTATWVPSCGQRDVLLSGPNGASDLIVKGMDGAIPARTVTTTSPA